MAAARFRNPSQAEQSTGSRRPQSAPLPILLALLTLLGILPAGRAEAGPHACAAPVTKAHRTQGTSCADVIVAPRGARKVYGGGGNDRIYAAGRVKAVYGGDGNDRIFVSPYGVKASGGKGTDVIVAALP